MAIQNSRVCVYCVYTALLALFLVFFWVVYMVMLGWWMMHVLHICVEVVQSLACEPYVGWSKRYYYGFYLGVSGTVVCDMLLFVFCGK